MPDVKEQVNRVERALTERNLKFDHIDDYESPMVVLGFGGGDFSFTHVAIHLVFDLDGVSAQLISSPIASAPVEKAARVLLTLNDCNNKYRWTKFYLDDDNDVIANGDVIFDEQNCADACIEMVMRTANIIDEAYGDIMKAIWG